MLLRSRYNVSVFKTICHVSEDNKLNQLHSISCKNFDDLRIVGIEQIKQWNIHMHITRESLWIAKLQTLHAAGLSQNLCAVLELKA